jgi:hypothetical protein
VRGFTCGFTIEDALPLNAKKENAGIDPGAPYSDLHSNLELLRQYASSGPTLSPDLPIPAITPESLTMQIEAWRQKPTVLITSPVASIQLVPDAHSPPAAAHGRRECLTHLLVALCQQTIHNAARKAANATNPT